MFSSETFKIDEKYERCTHHQLKNKIRLRSICTSIYKNSRFDDSLRDMNCVCRMCTHIVYNGSKFMKTIYGQQRNLKIIMKLEMEKRVIGTVRCIYVFYCPIY